MIDLDPQTFYTVMLVATSYLLGRLLVNLGKVPVETRG